jgi:nucleoside-diphosphate-sugar epimerase
MRVLVTGGSGFIGRNLIEYLARAHEVLAPTHAELDLTDPGALDRWFREHEVDVVVHGSCS